MHRSSLNHSFRLIFSEVLAAWVPVAEFARSHGKAKRPGRARSTRRALVTIGALGALNALSLAWAAPLLPTGGTIVAGSATVTQSGTHLTVTQGSDRMAANWQSFSIGAGHSVQFVQPSASAVALNRVLGPDASVIQGQLSANGQVFLLNPNGVLFTPTAQVNVGALVASTLPLSDADFLAGRLHFEGSSTQAITNAGQLSAAPGGTVALIAARIVNDGQIHAPGGAVLLGAGQSVTLDMGGPVRLQVGRGALQAQITNGGAITAAGGQIVLTAQAASDLGSAVINQTGLLDASSLGADSQGRIVLQATGAVIHTGVTQADGLHGGSIALSADALIDAGQWSAKGTQGAGGQIDLGVGRHLEQTALGRVEASGATSGGSARVVSQGTAYLSGSLRADGAAGAGGELAVTAPTLTLAGARLSARGAAGGGRVRVGGGWQGGDADLANAARTTVTAASVLDASATGAGHGGVIAVWSEQGTGAAGQIRATGGAVSGQGGKVEVSSRGRLAFGAQVDVGAPAGTAGLVLLDPKNIIIDGSQPASYTVTSLADPAPAAGHSHGSGTTLELSGGNLVVASPNDDAVAANAGAVRLYRPDGTLLSTLAGSTAGDQVGSGGVTALGNGHYVVRSSSWANGSATNAGAVTWGSGTTGVSGAVSAANSLVGSTASDQVGVNGITALGNNNYVVASSSWDNGSAVDAGP